MLTSLSFTISFSLGYYQLQSNTNIPCTTYYMLYPLFYLFITYPSTCCLHIHFMLRNHYSIITFISLVIILHVLSLPLFTSSLCFVLSSPLSSIHNIELTVSTVCNTKTDPLVRPCAGGTCCTKTNDYKRRYPLLFLFVYLCL